MILGGIWYEGKTPLYVFEANKTEDAEAYIEALDSMLVPYLKEHGLTLQQDGASSHTARITQQFLIDNQVALHWHPPKSPDMNPIEDVWKIMKNGFRADDLQTF